MNKPGLARIALSSNSLFLVRVLGFDIAINLRGSAQTVECVAFILLHVATD